MNVTRTNTTARRTLPWIVIAIALLSAGAARAQAGDPTATPRVDQRQAAQEQRIEQGQSSGALTPREALRLEREQALIARGESRAKADGAVTAQERARLHRAQDAAGRDIRRQKHDRQVVRPAG
jgi:uncharacterized membrane protein YebE (DUF533 family)